MPLNFDLEGKVYEPVEVTIAAEDTSAAFGVEREAEPLAGSVFLVEPGVRGMSTVAFAG